jgi:hypothetical protein
MRHVVFDVEIIKTIDQCSDGWNSTEEMGVGVAVVYDYTDDRYHVYGPEEVAALREHLMSADIIGGFNIWNFDYPVVWGRSKAEWAGDDALRATLKPKTDDTLRRIWLSLGLDADNFNYKTHGGYGLDDVAGLTIASKKIGHGADAPIWYQRGLIQKVANYCVDDVAIERELCTFVERYGYVIDPATKKRLPITAKIGD